MKVLLKKVQGIRRKSKERFIWSEGVFSVTGLIQDRPFVEKPNLKLSANTNGHVAEMELSSVNAKKQSLATTLKNFLKSAYTHIHFPKKPKQNFIVTYTLVLSL